MVARIAATLLTTPGRRGTAARPLDRWLTPVALVLVLSLAGLSLLTYRNSRSVSAAATLDGDDARRQQVQALRAQLLWLHQDALGDAMVAAVDGEAPDLDSLRRLETEVAERIEELVAIASLQTPAGQSADILVSSMATEGIGIGIYTWTELFLAEQALLYPDLTVDRSGGRTNADQAIALSALASYVLFDAAAIELAADLDAELSPDQAALVSQLAAAATDSSTPWLGLDRADPLDDFRGVVAGSPDADLLLAVRDSARGRTPHQQVWDYDDWLFNGEREAGRAAPLTIEELRVEVDGANRTTRAAFLDVVEANVAAARPERGLAFASQGWLATAIGAAAVAVAVIASLLAHRRTERLLLEDDALSDPLTGVRNRRYLDQVVAGRCRRRRNHHLLAMVDLDRFKQLNDTWGHDAGDALLGLVADRLVQVAAVYEAQARETCAAVVRLGGDEFAVVVNSPDRCEPGDLANRIRGLAGPVDLGLGSPVALELSVGVADATQPVELADLLKAADVAVYRDKRRRHGRTVDRDDQPTIRLG
ncbi:MAG: GGDEF domain-containing protein [Actinomycetota bacterium]